MLLEIEVQGAEQVRKANPAAVVILVLPPSMRQLEDRLRARGDTEEHVHFVCPVRPRNWPKGHELASYVVVNDDVERASDEILSILEGLRQQRRDPL